MLAAEKLAGGVKVNLPSFSLAIPQLGVKTLPVHTVMKMQGSCEDAGLSSSPPSTPFKSPSRVETSAINAKKADLTSGPNQGAQGSVARQGSCTAPSDVPDPGSPRFPVPPPQSPARPQDSAAVDRRVAQIKQLQPPRVTVAEWSMTSTKVLLLFHSLLKSLLLEYYGSLQRIQLQLAPAAFHQLCVLEKTCRQVLVSASNIKSVTATIANKLMASYMRLCQILLYNLVGVVGLLDVDSSLQRMFVALQRLCQEKQQEYKMCAAGKPQLAALEAARQTLLVCFLDNRHER